MNNHLRDRVQAAGGSSGPDPSFHIPVFPSPVHEDIPGTSSRKRSAGRAGIRREASFCRDEVYEVMRDGTRHIVSESYFYKTVPYYTILRHELEGQVVRPTSQAVLDASVVPVCLERAGLAGIPVCEWGISQGYAPVPSILYGLHYFATASEYRVVGDPDEAREAIRHITNKGKYPFCYQALDEGASIVTCTAIFGKTTSQDPGVAAIADQVYALFGIPLVTLVLVHDRQGYYLSSLSAARYSHLTPDERALLGAYVMHQEFL